MSVDRCREWKQDRADLAKCVDELERWRKVGGSLLALDKMLQKDRGEVARLISEIVEDMPK